MEVKSEYYQEASHVLAAAITLPVLSIVAVGMRFYARRKQRLSLETDDWFTLPAVTLAVGASVTMIWGISQHGPGYPVPRSSSHAVKSRTELSLIHESIIITSKVELAMTLMGIPALTCAKLSCLFFYKRIFCAHQIRRVAWPVILGMILIVIMWGTAFFFGLAFACGTNINVLIYGSTDDMNRECVASRGLKKNLAFTISDFLTDLIILTIPLPMVWNLHIPRKRMLGVLMVFLLGSVAVGASGARMVAMIKFFTVGFDPRQDEVLVLTGVLFWLMINLNLGLISACLPTMSCLLKGLSIGAVKSSVRNAFSLGSSKSQTMRKSHAEKSIHSGSSDLDILDHVRDTDLESGISLASTQVSPRP